MNSNKDKDSAFILGKPKNIDVSNSGKFEDVNNASVTNLGLKQEETKQKKNADDHVFRIRHLWVVVTMFFALFIAVLFPCIRNDSSISSQFLSFMGIIIGFICGKKFEN